ncbi:low temperature requirement protein A [Nesterenkonia sp. F]|uniref:low temperature requirement protein A n=1 Tax=Nesterenkonia sp. F TaxID=795955 RepID=UPI000682AF7E|nr:low temperature requirement protein A [Nesterenkonia sp. F]
MTDTRGPLGVLRGARPGTRGVGGMELFFDLVYVFTIIQLSHYLLHHLSWTGAAEAAILFAAVWWGWNYTAWALNWMDPQHVVVRVLMAVFMLCALGMAVAIPTAFGSGAGLFVGAYLLFQLLRAAFMAVAFGRTQMGRNYTQLLIWSALAGVVWTVGVFVPEEHRLAVWVLAVLVDYFGPAARFWVPGLGGSRMSTWPVDEAHLAERCRLVFIIALGESILILGNTLIEVELTGEVVLAALIGFAALVMLWWLYFSTRHGNSEHETPQTEEAAAMARAAYAYAHALMVGGAIVCAVAIELVVAHPHDPADWTVVTVLTAGPGLYLLGNLIFVRARTGRLSRSRLIALLVLAASVPLGLQLTTTGAAAVVALVLLVLLLATAQVRQSSRPAEIASAESEV